QWEMNSAVSRRETEPRWRDKLGAQREGVLRNHRRLAGGRLDDTFVYSITDHEWPQVKAALEASFTG
ncbi:N-acetyltransferase, partial [Pseudomonas aeruginosa]